MATLYVENVPEELYETIRSRAKEGRRSIAAEVLSLLAENVPTDAELERRRGLMNLARRLRTQSSVEPGRHETAEEMQAEDRGR